MGSSAALKGSRPPASAAVPPPRGERTAGTTPATSAPAPQRPVLLLVDDSADFLRAATRILEAGPRPFQVYAVASGRAALAFVRREPPFDDVPRPTLLVLDFNLPDLNAPAIVQELRSDAAWRALPILVLSQSPWAEDEAAVRAAGADHYAGKPGRASRLRDLIIEFLGRHSDAGDDPDR